MKILLTSVAVFLAFVAVAFAADCNVKGHGFNRGQKYSPPGECIEYTCNGKGRTSAINCAYSVAPARCRYVPENPRKRYPQCCPKYIC